MNGKKKKILVVDDEEHIVRVVKDRLEAFGYEVETAYDGQVGLEKAKTVNPDLMILDLMLPKLDGYQISRMLKFDIKYKHIPIILFTARAQENDKIMGQQVGADAYITKPFVPDILLAKIKELLERDPKDE